jgi:hypothetical protein
MHVCTYVCMYVQGVPQAPGSISPQVKTSIGYTIVCMYVRMYVCMYVQGLPQASGSISPQVKTSIGYTIAT